MKQSSVFIALLMLAATVSYCLGQINFTPHWGQGKRALGAQFEDHITQEAASCLEQTDLNLLLEMAKLLTREAKRFSSCLKGCPSL